MTEGQRRPTRVDCRTYRRVLARLYGPGGMPNRVRSGEVHASAAAAPARLEERRSPTRSRRWRVLLPRLPRAPVPAWRPSSDPRPGCPGGATGSAGAAEAAGHRPSTARPASSATASSGVATARSGEAKPPATGRPPPSTCPDSAWRASSTVPTRASAVTRTLVVQPRPHTPRYGSSSRLRQQSFQSGRGPLQPLPRQGRVGRGRARRQRRLLQPAVGRAKPLLSCAAAGGSARSDPPRPRGAGRRPRLVRQSDRECAGSRASRGGGRPGGP